MLAAQTLWELVCARAHATPGGLFAVDDQDRALSFAAYRDAACRAAAGLAALGVGAGATVSWMLPTRLEALVLAAALARLGAVQNPILPAYRRRELGFVFGQVQPQLLVVPSRWRGFDYEALAREIAPRVLVVDGSLPDADPGTLPAPPGPDPESSCWIFYTSGTTAEPKGVRHTDQTLLAASAGMAQALDLGPDDRHALVFPFTHVGGCVWLMAGLGAGAAHIVVEKFEAKKTADLLARHGVTMAGAGTVFHQAYLAEQRARGGGRLFPKLRACPGGGAPKPPQLHYDLKREMGGAGIVSGYGLTECPVITMNVLGDSDQKLAHTEGRPSPAQARIRVVRPGGGEAQAGQEGEIRLQGPQRFAGYVDAALDAAAFDEQGFFCTGDLGLVDREGYLHVTGRLKDVIIRKGENISAREVEDLLYTHPKVAEVAVVGLPDPGLGERACAVVVPKRADQPLGLGEMVAFLESQGLMRQKIPEQLELVAELPRNPSGKIEKRALRERFGQR